MEHFDLDKTLKNSCKFMMEVCIIHLQLQASDYSTEAQNILSGLTKVVWAQLEGAFYVNSANEYKNYILV